MRIKITTTDIVIEPDKRPKQKTVKKEPEIKSDEINRLYDKYTSDKYIEKMKTLNLGDVVKGAGFKNISEFEAAVDVSGYMLRTMWRKYPITFNFLFVGAIVKKCREQKDES